MCLGKYSSTFVYPGSHAAIHPIPHCSFNASSSRIMCEMVLSHSAHYIHYDMQSLPSPPLSKHSSNVCRQLRDIPTRMIRMALWVPADRWPCCSAALPLIPAMVEDRLFYIGCQSHVAWLLHLCNSCTRGFREQLSLKTVSNGEHWQLFSPSSRYVWTQERMFVTADSFLGSTCSIIQGSSGWCHPFIRL